MQYTKWIWALVLLAVPLISAAQMKSTDRMVTQVPFKFTVGAVEIPAGECVVQLADETGTLLAVRNPDSKRSVYVLSVANLGKKSKNAGMVFHRYGDRYFLAELRMEDSRTVYTLQPSKLEDEFRAGNISATQEILLASKH